MGQVDEEEIKRLAELYGVDENNFDKTKKICELLKDADALDRCRFANRSTLNPSFLRSQSARTNGMINFAKRVNGEMSKQILTNIYGKSKEDIIEGQEVRQLSDERKRKTYEQGEYTEQHLPLETLLEIVGIEASKEKSTPETKKDYNDKLKTLYERYKITTEDVRSVGRVFAERARKEERRTIEDEGR